MTFYRIDVKQTIDRKDESFSEYVETFEQASHLVNRFHDLDKDDNRFVVSITITHCHLQTTRETNQLLKGGK